MRESIINLLKNTVILKYRLPNGDIERCIHSTQNDYCYMSQNDTDISRIIYNSLIDYAFNENDMTEDSFEDLHIEALTQRIRFDEDDDDEVQLKYGFFGEVLLNLILRIFFDTNAIIAKGYFYDILKPEEFKGYDSYHLIDLPSETQLWFGEVKFHQSYTSAVDSVYSNIEKAISDDYFRKNLLALTPKKRDLETSNPTILGVINKLRKQPKQSIINLCADYNLKLVYPIFILCNSLKDYDKTISSLINRIKEKYSDKKFDIGIDYDLFFLILPVTCVKTIKQDVLKWIRSREPLTLL